MESNNTFVRRKESKMKKLRITLIVLLLGIFSCFILTSCGKSTTSPTVDDSSVHSHTLNHVESKSYTCTENGNIEYYSCDCGMIFSDSEGKNEISESDTVIKATHNLEYNVCAVCGMDISTEGLLYTLNLDNTSYTVTGRGNATDTEIVIPVTYNGLPVTAIGDYAFENCTALTGLTISESVTSIGIRAFSGCTSLNEINFNSIAMRDLDYDASAFDTAGWNTDGITVTVGKNVTRIPSHIFSSEHYSFSPKIIRVDFEENSICKSIGYCTFAGCSSLASITLPDSVTSIGSSFMLCYNLVSINIPTYVTEVSNYAFYDCYRLVEIINHSSLDITPGSEIAENTKIVHSENESKIVNNDGYLFITVDEINYLVGYVGNTTELNLPESYNGSGYKIYQYAFYGNDNITSLVISNGATDIQRYAFANCGYLSKIDFNVTAMNDLSGGDAFFNAGFKGDGITVTISKNVTKIPSGLFYTSYFNPPKIISVEFENGSICKSIGSSSFCQALITSITIPESVTVIHYNAFYGCEKLAEVINHSSINITPGSSESGCLGYYAKTVHNGNESRIVNKDGYLFITDKNGTNFLLGYVGSATELTLPESYNGKEYEIYQYAFYGNHKLTSVIIPDSVLIIGKCAFNNCDSIETIIFSDASKWYESYYYASNEKEKTELDVSSPTDNAKSLRSTYCYWHRY